ncbi:MAG: FAD-dependent oxidoreductase [Desulfurococcales archaeon]|jgi:thioredoxin reductase (NADPH)|nr:FAD-dependent oxidoreductase [Desulfurococcales archaeon]
MSLRLRIFKPAREEEYDVIVVGAGPAGLSAALYSARYRLKTLLIGETIGGQLASAGIVDDYPGLIEVEASELIQRFVNHVSKHGVPIVRDRVEDVKKEGDFFRIYTRSGTTYRSRAVIIAVGLERKKLGVPGEAEYSGKGVSYCTVCDVPFFKGKRIVIVGGGNSGVTGAIHAVGYASKICLVTRGERLRAFPVYVETLNKYSDKVEIILNSTVIEIGGDAEVRYAVIKNLKTGETRKVDVEGVFIEIGNQPPTDFFRKIGLEVDEKGLINVKPGGYTNIEGIFAAGDCAGGKNKYYYQQVITSAAEGAMTADAAFKWIIQKGYQVLGLQKIAPTLS